MIYLAYAVALVALLGAGVFLILHNHLISGGWCIGGGIAFALGTSLERKSE